MKAGEDRETGDAEHTIAPSMLCAREDAVRPGVRDDVYDEMKSTVVKKAASKYVQKSVVGDMKSVGRDGPGYVDARQMREGVQRESESDDQCQGEVSQVQGDAKGVYGKVEVSDDKKSRNLDEFGRVRRPGLSLQSRIHIFEQAQRGGLTSFDADSGSTQSGGKRGWN